MQNLPVDITDDIFSLKLVFRRGLVLENEEVAAFSNIPHDANISAY